MDLISKMYIQMEQTQMVLNCLIVNGKILKQMNQINQMIMREVSNQYFFLLMAVQQHYVVRTSLSVYGILKQEKKNLSYNHSDWVFSACFSPDGTTSCSKDKSIVLWDLKTGQQVLKFDGHSDWVYSVCFSPDGTALASCNYGMTGQEKFQLNGHRNDVNAVCFSLDGKTLASSSRDKSILLWDVQTGQQKAKLDGHTSYAYSVCFSTDGNTLASGSEDKSIRIWDVKTGQEVKSSNKNYKDVLIQFKISLQQNGSILEVSNYITTLLISQQTIFQAQEAQILKGEFINQSGIDLKTLLQKKGRYILETIKDIEQKKKEDCIVQ